MRVISESKIVYFRNEILKWYTLNGRYFSWRKKSATNYELIIAEVVLQRTKAETASNFFKTFTKKYHSWRELGQASEKQLQDDLRPIGLYKQRGSRLYLFAQEMKKRKGRFPKRRTEIVKLPMVGQYIANAIELFVFDRRSFLMDVNMARLFERFFGEREKADIRYDEFLQSLGKRITNHRKVKEINWGILDFASLICKARKPLCEQCPLSKECQYFQK